MTLEKNCIFKEKCIKFWFINLMNGLGGNFAKNGVIEKSLFCYGKVGRINNLIEHQK